MILLRFLSLLAGGLVMVATPMLMAAESERPLFFDGRTVLATMAGVALVASSFFFIGFAGARIRKSPPLRFLGALLLAAPFAASLVMLWRGGEEIELWMSALLFCFAAVLFVAFVFPAERMRKHRPMRRRESLAG